MTLIGSSSEMISSEAFEFEPASSGTTYVSDVETVAISAHDVVVCYGLNGDAGLGKCVAGTWQEDGTSLTFTVPQTFSYTNQASYVSLTKVDSADRVVVCYSAGRYDDIDTVVREEEGFGWCATGSFDSSAPNVAATFQIDAPTYQIPYDVTGIWATGSHSNFNAAPTIHISVDTVTSSIAIVCFVDNWNEVGSCVLGELGFDADRSNHPIITFPEAGDGQMVFRNERVSDVDVTVLDTSTAMLCYNVVGTGLACTGIDLDVASRTMTYRDTVQLSTDDVRDTTVVRLDSSTIAICGSSTSHETVGTCATFTVLNDGSSVTLVFSSLEAFTTADAKYVAADAMSSSSVAACYFTDTDEGDGVIDGVGMCVVATLTAPGCHANPAYTNIDDAASTCAGTPSGSSCQIVCDDGHWATGFARCDGSGGWDTETTCAESSCPYDPLVAGGGLDADGTNCEGTAAGATCDVVCQAGYGPNGVATCRRGQYERDRACRATNAEPLEWLNALNDALRTGTFRTALAAEVADASTLEEPLLTQAAVATSWHSDIIDVTVFVVGLTIPNDLTTDELTRALVTCTGSDVTTRIASHQIVSVTLSDVDVATRFESFHAPITHAVEARVLVEFPPNPCAHFDARSFRDENGHGCVWWANKQCSLGQTAYGLSASGQTDVQSNCPCACSLFDDWRPFECVSAGNESVVVNVTTASNDPDLAPQPDTSPVSTLVDDDDATDFVLRVSKLHAHDTFTEPVILFNLTHAPFPFALNRYDVVSNSLSQGYDPLTWTLEASNDDGGTWTSLHSVATAPFGATRKDVVSYDVANVQGYALYRVRILSATTHADVVNDNTSTGYTGVEFAVADIRLYSCSHSYPVPSCNAGGFYGRMGRASCFPSV